MNQLLFILLFGLVLGIKHAFEADHLVAVSTMVSRHKHPLKAALVGTFWGAGHTLTLFIVGIFVILFRLTISSTLSLVFEKSVGVMLVILGLFNFFRKQEVHIHTHTHDKKEHSHLHVHESESKNPPAGGHAHHKSFLVGVVHGLDGSGALMLLVLSSIHSQVQALYYILIFGIGSIIGMSGISFILGIPILYGSKKIPNLERVLSFSTGIISIGFGVFLLLQPH